MNVNKNLKRLQAEASENLRRLLEFERKSAAFDWLVDNPNFRVRRCREVSPYAYLVADTADNLVAAAMGYTALEAVERAMEKVKR